MLRYLDGLTICSSRAIPEQAVQNPSLGDVILVGGLQQSVGPSRAGVFTVPVYLYLLTHKLLYIGISKALKPLK